MTPANSPLQHYQHEPGKLRCLLSAQVGDINGVAPRDVADSLLAHLNQEVCQRKADYGSFLHTGMQHQHSPGVVFTHRCVYVGSITPMLSSSLIGKENEAPSATILHEVYRSVLGAVAWPVLTRAELAVYVQAL